MSDDILLYSGGVDSTLLLHEMRPRHTIWVGYGQHQSEIEREHALRHSPALQIVYARMHWVDGESYVPARNALLLSVAANRAVEAGAQRVLIGINADDAASYPDCSPEFVLSFNLMLCVQGITVRVEAPLIVTPKRDVMRRAAALFDLSSCWSCYGLGPKPCGLCVACRLRGAA